MLLPESPSLLSPQPLVISWLSCCRRRSELGIFRNVTASGNSLGATNTRQNYSLTLKTFLSSPYSCVSTGHRDFYREWRYHMLLVYNCVLLKMSTWCSKHVEENSILRINSYSRVSTGHQDSYREWRYHMLLVYNCVLLKMSTWCSKHVEENSILWINNSQCIKLVINV